MEHVQAELSRIVGYQNPYYWAIASCGDNGTSEEIFTSHRYYFMDRDGVNTYGDTALHRLLALQLSPSIVQNFLWHMKEHQRLIGEHLPLGAYKSLPSPPTVDQVNAKGATVLHVVVYRNACNADQIVKLLLDECPRLVSMAMIPCGSYPLHILAGHNITLRRETLDVLLEAEGGKEICRSEDCEGNNPLCLLWKNVLRFRWARRWEEAGIVPSVAILKCGDLSWMTAIAPCQYLDCSMSILKAAFARNNSGACLSWHDICGFPRCPPLLVRLLLQQQPNHYHLEGSLVTKDENDRMPLHCAAESPAVNFSHVPPVIARRTTSLVQILLLQCGSEAASIKDSRGRFPLHYACLNKSAASLKSIILACPEVLRVADPCTGLYPAFQVASRRDMAYQSDLTYEMFQACPEITQYKVSEL